VAFSITKRFIILCEGPADQIFFEKLLTARKISDIDIPLHAKLGRHHGWQGLGRCWAAIAGDPSGYAKLSGVMIIADTGDNATTTFNRILRKLAKDGPFDGTTSFIKPSAPYQLTRQNAGHPPISVMLIPRGRAGALETLCVESVLGRKVWLEECLNSYLGCGKIEVLNWPAEKRDKARMQCINAVFYGKDPNKPLTHILTARPPVIWFRSKSFTPIVNEIRKFCDQA
jgi:hypothetical protein